MTGCKMMIAFVYLANKDWYLLRNEIAMLNIF